MKNILIVLSLLLSFSVFAGPSNTCQKYSSSAWGISELSLDEVAQLSAREMSFNCQVVSGGNAYKKARVEYNKLPCTPQKQNFKELIDVNAEYRFCVGTYNYYNWTETTTFYFMNLDDETSNFVFGKSWDE